MTSRPLTSIALPPSILSALTASGYENVGDLAFATPQGLAEELKLSVEVAQGILTSIRKPQNAPKTQTAAHLAKVDPTTRRFPTGCRPVDKLIDGGLSPGQILEISGPPGSPKEILATCIVKSFVDSGEELLFVDMQNTISSLVLHRLANNNTSRVHYIKIHTLAEVMMLIHNLMRHLAELPKVSLLVLNSLSFPFQAAFSLAPSMKSSLLDQIKQSLAKACASRNICVVVTSQLATKLVGADGTPSNFDTSGSRGIMVPQLGPSYLPSGRSYRIVLAPDGRDSGVVRLLSSPGNPLRGARFRQESYVLTN